MEQKSQNQTGQAPAGKPHEEPVIQNRPRDPNWLGVGSEPDDKPSGQPAGTPAKSGGAA